MDEKTKLDLLEHLGDVETLAEFLINSLKLIDAKHNCECYVCNNILNEAKQAKELLYREVTL